MADFSSHLRDLRRQRGLTLQQLADRAGIHTTQLGRYERGLQPGIDAVVRLARALGVDPRELMEPVLEGAIANSPAPPVAV